MNERLTELRKALNLTMEKFGQSINLSKTAVSLMESGKCEITDRTISAICKEFDVNEEWIRTGEGDMFYSLDLESEIAKLTKDILSGEEEDFKAQFIKALARLTPEGWQHLEAVSYELLENSKKFKKNKED